MEGLSQAEIFDQNPSLNTAIYGPHIFRLKRFSKSIIHDTIFGSYSRFRSTSTQLFHLPCLCVYPSANLLFVHSSSLLQFLHAIHKILQLKVKYAFWATPWALRVAPGGQSQISLNRKFSIQKFLNDSLIQR